MSKVQVDTIDTRSGTSTMQIGSTNTSTINIGVSGDTVNIPSGVTIANAGTATGFGGGKILQVVNNLDTTARNTTSTTFVDVTSNSLDITPSATTSKVLLLYSAQGYKAGANEGYVTIFRDSSNLSTVTRRPPCTVWEGPDSAADRADALRKEVACQGRLPPAPAPSDHRLTPPSIPHQP